MSKTTFLGYVPSLKSKHEATIVGHKAIESKGGSIRYTLQGEYQGRKTLPKTVSKADFESVYGFDAKEAESAIIIGKNKKGDVDVLGYTTDAKDKTGFTPEKIVKWDDKELKDLQNYSNHDAESVLVVGKVDGPFGKQLEVAGHVKGVTDKKGFTPTNIQSYDYPILEGSVMDEGLKSNLVNHADTVGSPSPADVEPPAPSEKPFPQEPSNENFSADKDYAYEPTDEEMAEIWEREQKMRDLEPTELLEDDDYTTLEGTLEKEAFLGFGKKDEEEEEPKTQEFTVVLQEGDKLELTDIEEEEEAAPDEPKEEDSPEESENEEKEADEDMVERTFFITDAWYDTYDETDEDSFEDQYGYKQSDEQPKFEDEDLTLTIDAYPQEGYGEISDSLVDALSNSTGFGVYHFSFVEIMPDGSKKVLEAVQAKVTRPVKEDETEDDEESEGLSTLAKVGLGVGALAVGAAIFGAEEDDYIPYEAETDYTEIYGATSGDGYISHDRIDTEEQRTVELRHDHPTTYYNWNSPYDVDDTEVEDAIKSELGDEPGEGNYGATVEVRGSKYSQQGQKYVDVDVDMDTDYGDSRFMGMAAEHESESDGYAYAYTKGHQDGIGDEVIYRPSIATDKGRNIYKKILKQKAETFEAEGWVLTSPKMGRSGVFTTKDDAEKVKAWHEKHGNVKGVEIVKANVNDGNLDNRSKQILLGSETVGSPSPSGPSSTPEPAEATGSEPSNENMEAEGSNMKMALGILGVGVGAVALLGGDRIKKLFDRFGL